MELKRKTFLILKLCLSISIVSYILNNYIDIQELFLSLQNINIAILPLLIILSFFRRFLVAYQTKATLFSFQINVSTYRVFKIQLVATFYGLVLPGDIVGGSISWYLLSKDNGKRAEVASVLVYLRIINLITLLPFALIGIFFEPQLKSYHLEVYVFILSLLLIFILFLFFIRPIAYLFESFFNILILKVSSRLSTRLLKANRNIWNAINTIGKMPISHQIQIIVLSFLIQTLAIITMSFSLIAINIDLPILTASWLVALLFIITMLPITIAGIGVRDISLIFILDKFYTVSPESAVLLSTLLLFINTVFFGAILGGYYAITYRVN